MIKNLIGDKGEGVGGDSHVKPTRCAIAERSCRKWPTTCKNESGEEGMGWKGGVRGGRWIQTNNVCEKGLKVGEHEETAFFQASVGGRA